MDIGLHIPAVRPAHIEDLLRRGQLHRLVGQHLSGLAPRHHGPGVHHQRHIAEADRLPPGPRRLKHAPRGDDHAHAPILCPLQHGFRIFGNGNVIAEQRIIQINGNELNGLHGGSSSH